MLASWAVIVALNLGWTAFLWRRRSLDDPWLWKFFAVYAITDSTMWLGGDPSVGGLNLLTQDLLGRDVWIAWICAFWSTWILAPVYTALRIARNEVALGWVIVTAGLALMLSVSESLGLTPTGRRFLMHRIYEPILLISAIWLVARKSIDRVREGEMPCYLSFVVLASATLLMIRLVWLYDGRLELQRVGARILFFTYMFGIVLAYWLYPRLKRWLTLQS